MYYITNQDKQVIAADSSLIKLLNVKDINELYKEILLKNIQILPSIGDTVTIKTALSQHTFDTKLHAFSSLLGDFSLTEILKTDVEKNSPIIPAIETASDDQENKAIANLQSLKNRLASEKNRSRQEQERKDAETLTVSKEEKSVVENPVAEEKTVSETIETVSTPLEDDLLKDALFLEELETKEAVEEETTVEDTSSLEEELLLDTAEPETTSIEDTLHQEDLLDDTLLDDALFLEELEKKEEAEAEATVEDTISLDDAVSLEEELSLNTAEPETTSIEDTLLDDALFLEELEKKEEVESETTVEDTSSLALEDSISLDDTVSLEEELSLDTPETETISLEDTSAQESLIDDALFLDKLEEKEEEILVDTPEVTPMPLDDDLFNDDLFAEKTEEKEEVAPEPTPIPLDDDLFNDDLFAEKTEEKEEVALEPTPIPLDDDLFNDDLFAEKTEEKEVEVASSMSVPPIGEPLNSDDDILNLILNDEPEITLETITETPDEPIDIDVKSISESIGISEDDYGLFLDEYIQTARSFEDDLRNAEDAKRNDTLNTLTHLSNVLQLPIIAKSIKQIKEGSNDSLDSNIKSFYTTLTKLSQSLEEMSKEKEASVSEKVEEAIASIDELTLDEPIAVEEPIVIDEPVAVEEPIVIDEPVAVEEPIVIDEPVTVEEPIEEVVNTNSFGTISLEGIDPIHFDFQMEQAATDLGLPVDLIEEFVDDFIVQAHEETLKMLKCYEEGDLDAIQKIGHLLKGTSSNLRIAPLADTLYEIQFCEDSSKLEKLIKFYWAHFLSLETQVKLTKK